MWNTFPDSLKNGHPCHRLPSANCSGHNGISFVLYLKMSFSFILFSYIMMNNIVTIQKVQFAKDYVMHEMYLFDHLEEFDNELLERALAILPDDRRTKALSYRQIEDRKRSVISYLLLLYGLRNLYGITNPEFYYGGQGKPYLAGAPDIFFNISHCKNACVCAFSDCETGVDIQDIRPYSPATARRICCPDELAALGHCHDKDRTFSRIWSMKESYVKMTGTGITVPLNEINTTKLHIEVTEADEFFLSVCEKTGCSS